MAEPVTPSATEGPPTEVKPGRRFPWPGGLSARLLMLTALFVAIAGAVILPLALADFERQWLLDRVRAAELASTIADADPERRVTDKVSQQLLDQAGVVIVALEVDGARRLILPSEPRGLKIKPPYLVDLRRQNPGSWLAAPFFTLKSAPGSLVRVMAEPRFRQEAEFVEIVLPDAPLKALLVVTFWRLAAVTVFVALLAGGLIYLSLNFLMVRPMQRLTQAMERFRAQPEDPGARVVVSRRRDEIGRDDLYF